MDNEKTLIHIKLDMDKLDAVPADVLAEQLKAFQDKLKDEFTLIVTSDAFSISKITGDAVILTIDNIEYTYDQIIEMINNNK